MPENADGSGSRFSSRFIESWRFMAEAAVNWGPSAFWLFYSHMPGPDRRHGILIDRQPFIMDAQRTAAYVFQPYSTLMGFMFGSGVSPTNQDLTDASVIAVKYNHSIAANLVLSTSLLHATRVSHGYSQGFIRPDTPTLVPPGIGPAADGVFGTVVTLQPADYRRRWNINSYTADIPAIPTRDLGWEAMGALHWRLLNQFELGILLSYWKPGKWFNYACIDKSVPGWDNPTANNNWGVNPNRTIDPVLAFEVNAYTNW